MKKNIFDESDSLLKIPRRKARKVVLTQSILAARVKRTSNIQGLLLEYNISQDRRVRLMKGRRCSMFQQHDTILLRPPIYFQLHEATKLPRPTYQETYVCKVPNDIFLALYLDLGCDFYGV
jgi:hypothetical protein